MSNLIGTTEDKERKNSTKAVPEKESNDLKGKFAYNNNNYNNKKPTPTCENRKTPFVRSGNANSPSKVISKPSLLTFNKPPKNCQIPSMIGKLNKESSLTNHAPSATTWSTEKAKASKSHFYQFFPSSSASILRPSKVESPPPLFASTSHTSTPVPLKVRRNTPIMLSSMVKYTRKISPTQLLINSTASASLKDKAKGAAVSTTRCRDVCKRQTSPGNVNLTPVNVSSTAGTTNAENRFQKSRSADMNLIHLANRSTTGIVACRGAVKRRTTPIPTRGVSFATSSKGILQPKPLTLSDKEEKTNGDVGDVKSNVLSKIISSTNNSSFEDGNNIVNNAKNNSTENTSDGKSALRPSISSIVSVDLTILLNELEKVKFDNKILIDSVRFIAAFLNGDNVNNNNISSNNIVDMDKDNNNNISSCKLSLLDVKIEIEKMVQKLNFKPIPEISLKESLLSTSGLVSQGSNFINYIALKKDYEKKCEEFKKISLEKSNYKSDLARERSEHDLALLSKNNEIKRNTEAISHLHSEVSRLRDKLKENETLIALYKEENSKLLNICKIANNNNLVKLNGDDKNNSGVVGKRKNSFSSSSLNSINVEKMLLKFPGLSEVKNNDENDKKAYNISDKKSGKKFLSLSPFEFRKEILVKEKYSENSRKVDYSLLTNERKQKTQKFKTNDFFDSPSLLPLQGTKRIQNSKNDKTISDKIDKNTKIGKSSPNTLVPGFQEKNGRNGIRDKTIKKGTNDNPIESNININGVDKNNCNEDDNKDKIGDTISSINELSDNNSNSGYINLKNDEEEIRKK